MLHDDSFLEEIAKALPTDKFVNAIKEGLIDPSKLTNKEDLDRFRFEGGLLYRDHLLYVPKGRCQTQVLQRCHDDPLAGHFGVTKTLDLISRGYWCPQPWKFVKEFIKTCDTCARSKLIHHMTYGLLQPLPIPNQPWASISMDMTHCSSW